MSSQTQHNLEYFHLKDFAFESGARLPTVHLAYKVYNPDARKIALIPTCFRGRIESTPNFANDTLQDYRVIVVALFGNGESSSPSNTTDFPESLDYRDCVKAQYALLTEGLGVSGLDATVGFSMGGQCTYYWAAMYPEFVRNAVIICSSAKTSLHNIQFLEGPRAALENSIDYTPMRCRPKDVKVTKGLNAFGKAYSAWLTSAEWFDQEKFKDLGFNAVCHWDEATTSTNYTSWDPDDLLAMLRMWQNGDITKCMSGDGAGLVAALSAIKSRVLLLPCETDQYFRPTASERELPHLRYGTLQVIPSIWGHLAGAGSNPQDHAWVGKQISGFLGTEEGSLNG